MFLIFDIGGSSTKIAIIDENFKMIDKYKKPKKDSLEEFLLMLEEETEKNIRKYSIKGIGISSPGSVNPLTGQVKGLSAVEYISEYNFAYHLRKKYDLFVAIENDANCSALSEIYLNKPKEKNICFFVIGSGIGGAVILDGNLIHSRRFESGEFGYMLLKDETKITNLSRLATLPNVVKKMNDKYGIRTNTYELMDKFIKKEEPYYSEVDLMFKYLCMGLYNVQYTLDPDVIYIGGAISQSNDYIEAIKQKLSTDLFANANIEIRQASFFNDNNLYGACANLINMIEKGGDLCIQSE